MAAEVWGSGDAKGCEVERRPLVKGVVFDKMGEIVVTDSQLKIGKRMNKAKTVSDIFDNVISQGLDRSLPENEIEVDSGFHGIVHFDKTRLESKKAEIAEILLEMDDNFFISGESKGWTFLNLPFDRHGDQWCEQPTAAALCILGIALQLVKYVLPKEFWVSLPGGVPYLSIDDEACRKIIEEARV